ncbi:MAG: biotin transporter BioY [Halanaerobiaceae bacterium]
MLKKLTVNDMILSALFAALTGILSYLIIPLPFSPVPVTGQTLAVMLTGSLLKTRQAVLSIILFLLMGIAGIPVFSGGTAGIGVLVGPTGGYLFGFLIGVIVISKICNNNSYKRIATACIIGGIFMVHIPGFIWMSLITDMSIKKALMAGSIPFLPGDLIKVIIATFITIKMRNQLQKI